MNASCHISLSELQTLIGKTLDDALSLPLWVSAEISELKVNYSGHCYLELVEKGGPDSIPCARCSAVIWRSRYASLASYFEAETGNAISVGLKVLLKVSVNYHPLYGLSLVVLDIDPAYTLGDWQRQRLQTIAQLKADGVIDMNRQLPPVPDALRIAVVSSATAAGFQDFCKQILDSPYGFSVRLFDAYMQGHQAEESVIAALERIAERAEEFDVVVMIRGGGSQSDLSCFNSYRLCSHIAQFPLPVITGIGHDKDTSVADMVAYRALKTPTAVAALLIDTVAEQDARLDEIMRIMERQTADILDTAARRIENAARSVSLCAIGMTRKIELRLERLNSALERLTGEALLKQSGRIDYCEKYMRKTVAACILRHREMLGHLRGRVEAHEPRKILSLGFAIVRSGGAALHDASKTDIGQQIEITLDSGELRAKITDNGKTKNLQ